VTTFKSAVIAALIASTVSLQPVPALAQGRGRGHDKHHDRRDRDDDRYYDYRDNDGRRYDGRRYEAARYDAARYYRNDGKYKARYLGRNDRIYRGSDNRYYCRHDDGTTGLIVGAISGGVLGGVIAPGDSKTIAAILGAGVGAFIGREIDNGVECR